MFKIIISLRPYSRFLLIIWALTIIFVSSIPSIPTLKIHTARVEIRLDYLIHFCEYGLLAFMAFLSFSGNDYKPGLRKYILISLSLIAFAILDEFHQKFIPGRAFNVRDIESNIIGIIAALLFCLVVFRKIGKRIIELPPFG